MSNNSKEFDSLSEKKKIILERLLREKKEEKEKQTTDIGTIQRRKQEGPVPLSFAQQRMWFLEQLEPGSHAYNIPSAMRITGKLDIPALEQSLNTIIKRHESMRTIFEEADGIPTQVIKPHLEIKMDYMDLRNITEEEKESRVKEFATEDNRKPYNLSKGPLIRASLLQLYNEEHILILNMHHIISDGWSMRVLMQEIGAVYCGILDGKNVSLPELNIQYADYASWQRNSMQGEYLKQQLEVWKKQLEGCNFVLEVPTDHPRPPVQSFKGSRHYIELPENLVKTLNDMCRQKGVTMFMMLLAAFKVLLLRYTGQGDMVVGTPVAGRSRTELEGLIGFFVNMLVLRTDLSDNPSFSELLHRVRKMNLEAIANQDVPFENLVEELQPQRDLSRNPLFQVAFGYQSETIPPVEFKGLSFESIEVDSSTARFDIEFQTWKSGSGISGYLEYSTDLYSKDTIKRMADYYKTILEGIAANPDRPVMSIPLMPEEEKRKILTEWNNTKADFPEGKCINQMFEEQVDKTPDAVAVIFDGTQLTYSELNEKANRLAGYLRKAGVGPGVPVGICMERSLEMVVGIYGIVKAGGAYLPIDPEYPKGRREFMINDAQVRILLTQEKIVGELPENDAELLCLDTHWERLTGESVENTSPNLCPEDPVYIIYTSGSTGKPKGVVNIHKGLVNRLNWMQKVYSLGAHDRVMQKTPFSFDVSVWEFFWPLLNGACLVVAKPGGHRDSDYLISLINEMKITTIHFVPSMLRLLLENDRAGTCRSLRRVICSGEALPYSLQEKFFAALEQTELHNLYGPTEASIDVTSWECRKNYGRRIVPIGRPIDNTSIYILDSNLEPLPVGIPGEIHIGGIGLAKGYYKRPELTAEKFIPDPFSKVQNENALSAVNPSLMYKTGDLARYLPDGNIEFLGRIDHQVKLRGLRIELEEIEFAVASYSGIQEAVVIVREDNPGDMRLVAYMTEDKENPVNIGSLRSFLRDRLPEYMVPSAFIVLDSLPLTPNGKLDRKSLPVVENSRRDASADFAAPSGETEQIIADIWKEVLKVDNIGANDSFFDLGGHSMLMTQVYNKLKNKHKYEITMVDMFKYPTVSSLAAYLTKEREGRPQVEKYTEDAKKRKSATNSGTNDIAVISIGLRFPGAKNPDEFWSNLENGVESISFFTDEEIMASGVTKEMLSDPNYVKADGIVEDVEYFDAPFFGYSPKEAEIMDPQQRFYLECAWETLERAGYNPEVYEGRIGSFSGINMSTYLFNNIYSSNNVVGIMGNFQVRIPYLTANDKDFLNTRVAYKLNLKGPCVSVQTACSSSMVAVHMACQSLLNYESDMALAGGVTIKVPQKMGYLYQEGGVPSPDGHCRAFDADGAGAVPGNGVGIVLLKRLSDAIADGDDIYAVIKASAINNDGSMKVGFTAPSAEGQMRVISEALAKADINPDSISYVEAFGTATQMGDSIEVDSLTKVYRLYTQRKKYCGIGSVKTNVGHLDTATGIASLIKTALCLKNRKLVPNLHFKKPNPNIDFENSPFYVVTETKEWESTGTPRRAGVSCFGIGGTNVHVIMEEAPAAEEAENSRPYQLLLLSARSQSALETAASNMAAHLKKNPGINLGDAAYTMATGRKVFKHRMAVICRDVKDAVRALDFHRSKKLPKAFKDLNRENITYMFPGLGNQYVNMALELYSFEQVFRNEVEKCSGILRPVLGMDICRVLYPGNGHIKPGKQETIPEHMSELALFIVEYALSRLLNVWGIKPGGMIGHGIGEYTAACISGVLSLEDALKLLAVRGKLLQGLPQDSMLMVLQPEEKVREYLGSRLSVAIVNEANSCMVSGKQEDIDALKRTLEEKGVSFRQVKAVGPSNSYIVESIKDKFLEEVRKIKLSPPAVKYLSSVTGSWIKAEEATDPVYWVRHLRDSIRFYDGVKELLKNGDGIILEVGPGQTLSSLIKRQEKAGEGHEVLNLIPGSQEKSSACQLLLNALGTMWTKGISPDWNAFYRVGKRLRVKLPTYPFERKRYWIDPPKQVSTSQIENNSEKEVKELNESSIAYVRPQLDSEYMAPRNETEKILAEIWQECLGIEKVGTNDNFFELGGDSVVNIRITAKANQKGIRITPKQLLSNQTIAELALQADKSTSGPDTQGTLFQDTSSSDFNLAGLSEEELDEIASELEQYD